MIVQHFNARYHFELLTEQHDVSAFTCATSTWLDLYIKQHAVAETQRDLSRTHILIDEDAAASDAVMGYFTIRADYLHYTDSDTQRTVFIPVAELSYLARHIRYKGKGIGEILLYEMMRHAVEAAKWINIAAISLEATDEGRKLYDRFGFGSHPYGNRCMLLSIADARLIVQHDY